MGVLFLNKGVCFSKIRVCFLKKGVFFENEHFFENGNLFRS